MPLYLEVAMSDCITGQPLAPLTSVVFKKATLVIPFDCNVFNIVIQRNIFIFPNLYLFESHIRVIRPLKHDSSVVEVYPTVLGGADQEVNSARLREHERFFGPASFGATDDIEMFVSAQSGARADYFEAWFDMSRGPYREKLNEDGSRVGHSTDEVPQRSAYRQWLACMTRELNRKGIDKRGVAS